MGPGGGGWAEFHSFLTTQGLAKPAESSAQPTYWVLVTYRAVEVPARRHIEYAAADGQINRLVINAVELEESGWGEGAEDDGRRALGQGDGALRTELHVDEDNEKG